MDITSDDILGKDAIDPEGAILGVITKLHVHKQSKQITGITIDQGFMKPELFVGIKQIKNFGIDSVFLNKIPWTTIKGIKVITNTGAIKGKVNKVISKRNKIQAIIVGEENIPASKIESIGYNVILKK